MSSNLVSQYPQLYDFDIQNHFNKMNTEHLAPGAPLNNFQRSKTITPIGTFSSSSNSAFVPVTSGSSSIIPSTNVFNDTPREHRKLDRCWSEPCDKRNCTPTSTIAPPISTSSATAAAVNSTRYKTELCRPFEENGHCKYGDKCQFAHGKHELQTLARHPKYKTDLCRTFHTIGFCPYGPRCHFIHSEEERKVSRPQVPVQHPGVIQPPQPIQRPNSIKFHSLSSLGSSMESPSSSVNASPTTLSPSFLGSGEDIFSSANMPSFSPNNQHSVSSGSSRSSPVFSNEYDWMTPLNVQTQNITNNNELNTLNQQFNGLNLNLNVNQKSTFDNINNQNVFEDIFLAQVFRESQTYNDAAPSTSPADSVSGLSVGSSGSSSSGYVTCNSPMDVGRNMRLPIFNRLSQVA